MPVHGQIKKDPRWTQDLGSAIHFLASHTNTHTHTTHRDILAMHTHSLSVWAWLFQLFWLLSRPYKFSTGYGYLKLL